MIKIKRGLDIPISGEPEQKIADGPNIRTVALSGSGVHGLKPTMCVQEGEKVRLGQLLFTDKKNPGVNFTSPGCGTVASINRGAKRAFQSLVINLEGDDSVEFKRFDENALGAASAKVIQDALVENGSWTMLRTRPYGKIPELDQEPDAIFITATDSNPLAPDSNLIISEGKDDLAFGIWALSKLTTGKTYLCVDQNASWVSDLDSSKVSNLHIESFSGPHPSGLAGTHIHFLAPVNEHKMVWQISYEQVIALARTLKTGKLSTDRIISIAGPQVESPGLVKTRLGASTEELCAGALKPGKNRVIIGSVLSGSSAEGSNKFLSDSARQISVIKEEGEREFAALVGHVSPHLNRHSVKNLFFSKLFRNRKFDFTAALYGGHRAMVPIGSYEEVTALDILPTQLLRAILVGDTETALDLGALELLEEDVSLYTYVCPGKYEYGPVLRDNLTTLELDS